MVRPFWYAQLLLPLVAGEYYINLASQIVIFAVFAASINLLLGYGGLPTLGHAAYLGVAGGNVRVRGLGIDSIWTTNLKVGGTADSPRFTGRADLVTI